MKAAASRRWGFVTGVASVGGGLLWAGAFTYAFLSMAGRLLGPEQFAPVSTLWALVFIVGPGLFLPLQQELGRLLAGQRVDRGGGGAARRVVLIAAVMVVLVVLGTLPLSDWATRELFGGDLVLFWCFEGSVAAYAATFTARGVLSGLGQFGALGGLIGLEALSRLVIAALLWLAGWHEPGAFGVAIAAAPLVSTVVTVTLGRSVRMHAGVTPPWREVTRAFGWLVAGSLLAQVVANAGPVVVQLLATPAQAGEAGRFLSALVIARVTLYLFQAVQATILPNLSELVAHGRDAELVASLRRLTGACLALVVVSALGGMVLGPFAVTLLFGKGFDVGARTMAVLAGASAVYVLAASLTAAAIALAAHRLVVLAWFGGAVGFLAGASTTSALLLRVELGYAVGSAVAAAVYLVALPVLLRRRVPRGAGTNAEIGGGQSG